jgi:hypothetical protein
MIIGKLMDMEESLMITHNWDRHSWMWLPLQIPMPALPLYHEQ